ncbi:3-hydroxy-9,10-secoandrosta-1,3,5(10)-triene-9,17-dione monooxygenase reductase component [Pseudarthrobacter sp. W1I19]|uniref:flavin reductase family protein n=1 Tax=Pseudarthrobacter sp. W1I19 TaxID=3042288 RepID=UPI00278A674C|nr:flavin reductase family protein [Pseudarthrobacter sp. W1I19]MDQ0925617.1 3-hydroxy-9,10-secoandrosta-1,3,5(10)-triene-9,17-dione monooxygenase reductase component [Pseudarthrobacter sp. W1I19]
MTALATFETGQAVDPQAFRVAMKQVPTPVAIVTAMSEEGPLGMTVGSFTSVSLSPALVTFFVDVSSTTWPRLKSSPSFTINILGHDKGELCRAFSRRGADRFDGVDWSLNEHGNPSLADASVTLDCTVYSTLVLGDHIQLVGEVQGFKVHHEGMPLVFFNGSFLDLRERG